MWASRPSRPATTIFARRLFTLAISEFSWLNWQTYPVASDNSVFLIHPFVIPSRSQWLTDAAVAAPAWDERIFTEAKRRKPISFDVWVDWRLMMMMMMSWCLMSSDVIWHIRDKLWPMPKHGSIKSTYVRCMRVLAVTCHLHFWQNDRDFLRATVVTRGWNGYRNKSQHRKSTLEKKILPPFQQGFEPATFQSRVRCSNHWLELSPPP